MYWLLPFLFTPLFTLVLFFLFCASKEKEKNEKKEKIAVVFYALAGIGADLAFASKAGPASRFSYARYWCLRTTLAVCALFYLASILQVPRLPSPRGRVRVGAGFSLPALEPNCTPFISFTPNVTEYVLSYIQCNQNKERTNQ